MIIDASAIVAILNKEPERVAFANAFEAAIVRRISAVSYVEAAAVIERKRNLIASYDFTDFSANPGSSLNP